MAEQHDYTAPLTPADHLLVHALSLYLSDVVRRIGPQDSLGMVLRMAGRKGCGDHPLARQLHVVCEQLLRAEKGSAAAAGLEVDLVALLRDFHTWRMRLALDRIEEGGGA